MNLELGIGIQSGWEYLRVGRILRLFPTLKALFRAGRLTWSKVRLITRVVNECNEKILCHTALDGSVSEVVRLCQGYRWNEDDDGKGENERALKQWDSRSLSWHEASNGSIRIQLILPPEMAQAFLNSVEQSLNQLEESDSKLSQCRADAAVLMAETSLQTAGRQIATADRYQVIVSVDATELSTANSQNTADCDINTPAKRPTVKGAGPIARETARRRACDCSLSINQTTNGEPIDIGRKSRIWPNAMARIVKERDQHCVWPGCTHSNHLHIQHIKHWADGGTTTVQNSACLCSHHHTQVHEGGYNIERVENDDQRLKEQFAQQQHADDLSLFDFEKELRNDEESFNTVRKLSPCSYRIRIVDAQGGDIRDNSNMGFEYEVEYVIADSFDNVKTESTFSSDDYTRVYCAEPVADYYHDIGHCRNHDGKHGKNRDNPVPSFSYEVPACYIINAYVQNIACH